MKSVSIAFVTLLMSSAVALAADFPLVGTWQFQGTAREEIATGTRTQLTTNSNRIGFISFTPEGRMSAIIVPSAVAAAGAPPPTLLAYFGPYTTDGPGKVTYHVEASIHPEQIGSSIPRTFTLKGDDLTLATLPAKGPDGETRTLILWRRVNR